MYVAIQLHRHGGVPNWNREIEQPFTGRNVVGTLRVLSLRVPSLCRL